MLKVVLGILGKICIVILILFVLSIVIYFTNADMKLSAKMAKLLEPHYDKMKRDRRI